jgi:hypothetical protein
MACKGSKSKKGKKNTVKMPSQDRSKKGKKSY